MNSPPHLCTCFSEFAGATYQKHKAFCDLTQRLQAQINEIFKDPVAEPLHKVLRHLAKMTANSFGAVFHLGMNGFGYDAMKVVRNMFEASVTIAYLRKHPDELRDFMDYHWIVNMRRYRYMEQSAPELLERVSPEAIKKGQEGYAGVVDRFRKANGDVRGSWSAKPFLEMCRELGTQELYETVYRLGSDIQHAGMSAIIIQADPEPGVLDVDIAPSDEWVGVAFASAHAALVVALGEYQQLAFPDKASFGQQLDADFVATWRKRAPE